MRSIREHGPLIWLPTVAGTATQLPLILDEVLDGGVDVAVYLHRLPVHDVVDGLGARRSSAGEPPSAWARISWPALASASTAMGEEKLVALREGYEVHLDISLLFAGPLFHQRLGRFLAPRHPRVIPRSRIASLPAAPAVRTKGGATSVADTGTHHDNKVADGIFCCKLGTSGSSLSFAHGVVAGVVPTRGAPYLKING